jgi:hypothetical protein
MLVKLVFISIIFLFLFDYKNCFSQIKRFEMSLF